MIEKTPVQVWAQLETLYGDARVIVQEAMQSLHKLEKSKNKRDFMVLFATTLEDTEALLAKEMNESHLKNDREVEKLLDMIPIEEKRRFVERKKNYGGTQYEKFKAFMVERKAEDLELHKLGSLKLDSDDEEDDGKKCGHCGIKGHKRKECWKLAREEKGETSKDSKDVCFRCQETGHKSFQCTASNPVPKKKNDEGYSVSSNNLRSSDCGRCKGASSLGKPCGGCGKQSDLKHCLAHCSKYGQE